MRQALTKPLKKIRIVAPIESVGYLLTLSWCAPLVGFNVNTLSSLGRGLTSTFTHVGFPHLPYGLTSVSHLSVVAQILSLITRATPKVKNRGHYKNQLIFRAALQNV